ncbi:MAG: type II CAAX prenyl endopeptidase Rce1 family protein [Vulcanococcus sp.]
MAPAPAPRLHWWGTLLYPLGLVAVFLGGQLLLGLVGVAAVQRAALAAGPAVLALVLSLPWRLRRCWGSAHPWRSLGVRAPLPAVAKALLRGLIKAAGLLALVLLGLGALGQLRWQPQLSAGLVLNGLALGLGVGFAEELLFRGWLLGELSLLLGAQRALGLQAVLFSLVHTRFNLPLGQLLALLGGLLLLGLALGLQRRADGQLLWGAVGLHGGLVGGWFVLQSGVVAVNIAAPAWLMGPANPIGGVLGWLGLALLLLARRRWWRP